MQRDVEQAAEPCGEHRRQRTDRRRIEHATTNHAQTAGPLGHEHAAVGHEHDAPGMIEPLDRRHVDADAAAGAEIPRTGAERVGRRGPAATTTAGWRLRLRLRRGARRLLLRGLNRHTPKRDDGHQGDDVLLQGFLSCVDTD